MRRPYEFGICGGVFVFRFLLCVFVEKKFQSERMLFREMTGMGGGWPRREGRAGYILAGIHFGTNGVRMGEEQ
jgi:hypothetical protein